MSEPNQETRPAGTGDEAWTPGPPPASIIDAHHHFWRMGEGRYPWLQDEYDPQAFFLGDYASICQDFDPQVYRTRTQGYPVVTTVHVEAERARDEALAETQWLHALHEETGLPGAVVAYADFGSAGIEEALARQAAYPLVRGIRCKPRTARGPDENVRGLPGTLQDERWLAGLARLAQHGMSWDLRVPYWHLEESAEVAARFPDIPIVLNHAGLPWDRSPQGLARWRRGMQALAQCGQVYVKLSELGLRDAAWDTGQNARILRETVDIFGWQRCMFASNMPVSGLNAGFATLVDTVLLAIGHLPPAAQAAIWRGNAQRFYRIAL